MAKTKPSADADENVGALTGGAAPAPAAAEEALPDRGGSFTRNADGSLTQTEGHGFAHNQE